MVIIKSIRNVFYSKLKFELFMEAYKRASINKSMREEVILFSMDLENNIYKLMEDIRNNNYYLGDYYEFTIYEPKERVIRSLPFRDRIVHQWYIEAFIKPYFCKRFIYDSYACIDNKGTHKAVKRVQYFMRKMKGNYYVIKCDIRKYFESIDKDILFDILRSRINDKRLIEFTYKMVYENNYFSGICIGNYTSQYFANIYLHKLDVYVKEVLRVKYYVRYMDDFILLVESKSIAKEIYRKIESFLSRELKLELNKKSKYYPGKLGIDFCGFVIFENYIRIRKRCKRIINKKIRLWNYLYRNNRFSYKKFILSYNSFLGHIKHSNSYNYLNKVNGKIEVLK